MIPFKYGRIVKAEDFCGREDSILEIKEYIESAQNLLIQGERRIGKSSLIAETVRQMKNRRFLSIDLMMIKSVNDLIQRMIKAILLMKSDANFMTRTLKTLSHLKPQIGIDPISHLPTVSIDVRENYSPNSLDEVLDLIQKLNRKTVVFFDEFQDILSIPESKETIAILRSKIQYHDKIPYIFAGSIRNKMDEIFNSPDSPLFKSAIAITVESIEQGVFSKFIKEKFTLGKRSITHNLISKVYDFCDGISGDIQQLCEAIWSVSDRGEILNEEHLSKAFNLIFSRERTSYELIIDELTEIQTKCLIGLAKSEGRSPTSSLFLRNSGIQQPSTVKKAIIKLTKRKIIFKHQKQYRFTNPFFKHWLLLQ